MSAAGHDRASIIVRAFLQTLHQHLDDAELHASLTNMMRDELRDAVREIVNDVFRHEPDCPRR
jgi:hypothetical protein